MTRVKKYKTEERNCWEELNELVLVDMKEMIEVYVVSRLGYPKGID